MQRIIIATLLMLFAVPMAFIAPAASANPGICTPGADTDGDGIKDENDNCCTVANPAQTDADGDNIGNFCDADYNNDGLVNSIDLGILKSVFFGPSAVVDCDGNGIVNTIELGCLIKWFFLAPGPSCISLGPAWLGPLCVPGDNDGDGIPNGADNCVNQANPTQLDTDGDGFGNICDGDLNNDCIFNFLDQAIFSAAFPSTPASPNWNRNADFDGDMDVDATDFAIFQTFSFFGLPGPSALAACSC